MSQLPGFDDFQACIGDEFTPADGGPPFRLVEATARPSDARATGGFSLEFEVAESTPTQRTVELEHPSLGPHAIFVVPIGADGDRLRYEAVFTSTP